MKQIFICLLTLIMGIGTSSAQEDGFYLQLQSDTVLAGNVLQVSFVANNVAGKFEGPAMEELNVVSGPNTSSSMSIVNGTVTQHASYSYGIYVEGIREVIIPPAYFVTSEGTLETEPTRIIVLPNPEGIIEQPPSPYQSGMFQFNFPEIKRQKKENKTENKPKKKKRKLKKI
jgi:hypothetical protein